MMTKPAMRIDMEGRCTSGSLGTRPSLVARQSPSMRAQLTLCCRSWAMDHLCVNLKSEIRLDDSPLE